MNVVDLGHHSSENVMYGTAHMTSEPGNLALSLHSLILSFLDPILFIFKMRGFTRWFLSSFYNTYKNVNAKHAIADLSCLQFFNEIIFAPRRKTCSLGWQRLSCWSNVRLVPWLAPSCPAWGSIPPTHSPLRQQEMCSDALGWQQATWKQMKGTKRSDPLLQRDVAELEFLGPEQREGRDQWVQLKQKSLWVEVKIWLRKSTFILAKSKIVL